MNGPELMNLLLKVHTNQLSSSFMKKLPLKTLKQEQL
jgi:hypothetical protein